MAFTLGWKDILRPIRDGYRHLFPSPDTGPTPEERARQRELDQLKGFAYFDTIGQLESWTYADSDPIQRANTPLLPRPSPVDTKDSQKTKATMLLCHDYSGNYHEYEAAHGLGVDEESYTCEYLQYVDTFIYFSHKLVCVPPPSWTNTLHRNGVQALGTILVEPQTKDADRLLLRYGSRGSSEDELHFPVAKKLAEIAQHYGFDGWLVNIEKPFSTQNWDPDILVSFLHQLREDLGPSRTLIWYDALTVENRVAYQNALTSKNIEFSKTCGRVLTNYSWKESDALSSKQLALESNDLSSDHIFFGIDVWAQNKAPITRRRTTYPEKSGGGTLVGTAVDKLSELGLSAGVFAPAWTFEHFTGGHSRAIEKSVWEGLPLPEITCSCGDVAVQHPSNRGNGIARSAIQFPAGSDSFFYTDFSRGFGRHSQLEADRLYGGKLMHSQLASQSILPRSIDQTESSVNILSHRLEELAGRTQLVLETHSAIPHEDSPDQIYERYLPLFNLDMPADGSLLISFTFTNLLRASGACVFLYLRISTGIKILRCDGKTSIDASVHHRDILEKPSRLQEIGVHLQAPQLGEELQRIMQIQDIRIRPKANLAVPHETTLRDVRVVKRGEGEREHWRLCWTFVEDKTNARTLGIPYSDVTGPFSYFFIRLDGLEIGRAYALEDLLPTALMKELGDGEVDVEIVGMGFDGRELARTVEKVRV